MVSIHNIAVPGGFSKKIQSNLFFWSYSLQKLEISHFLHFLHFFILENLLPFSKFLLYKYNLCFFAKHIPIYFENKSQFIEKIRKIHIFSRLTVKMNNGTCFRHVRNAKNKPLLVQEKNIWDSIFKLLFTICYCTFRFEWYFSKWIIFQVNI